VFAVDLNGHYSVVFACVTETHGNTLVLINSTETVYEENPMMTWIFDSLFPPPDDAAAHVCAGPGDGVANSVLDELCAMGFLREKAQCALVASGGRLDAAVDVLLSRSGGSGPR